MQRIFMMRHGQSLANAQMVVAGQQESPLTDVGRQQVTQAGQQAKTFGIDLIVCSPMGRTQETAQLVADIIDYPEDQIRINPDLIERRLGDLEGTNYSHNEKLNGNFPETEQHTGVEPLTDLHARVQRAFKQIKADASHQNILIVCHQNVGRMLWAIINNQPATSLYEQSRLENGEVYTLTPSPPTPS